MLRFCQLRFRTWILVSIAILLFCGVFKPAQQEPIPEVSFTVVVKEADTGDPISQARLTLTLSRESFTALSRTMPKQMLKVGIDSRAFQKKPSVYWSPLSVTRVLAKNLIWKKTIRSLRLSLRSPSLCFNAQQIHPGRLTFNPVPESFRHGKLSSDRYVSHAASHELHDDCEPVRGELSQFTRAGLQMLQVGAKS